MNPLLFTTAVTAVVLVFAVSFSLAEEIEPLSKWNGKHHAGGLKKQAPADNAIRDSKSWESLWAKWRPDELTPKIDFDKNMVVVATVHGPNQIMVSRINLDADGNLQFNAASTKIGGPGFGYILIEIPRAGIMAINGTALKDKPESQPIGDSIQLDITGTVRTGVMAIGGETTGATISSKGLTFELDFHRIRTRIESLNGKRLRVTGELNVQKGIEIKQRLIIKVADFRVLSPEDGGQAPETDTFMKITIKKTGGFAGLSITTTILPTGKVTRENRQKRVTESFDMKSNVLHDLQRMVGKTDWSTVPKKTITPGAADLFLYTITVQTEADQAYEMTIDDLAFSKVPALEKLLKRLNHLLN